MANLDDWLVKAAQLTNVEPSQASLEKLEQRLATEPSPRIFAARREFRRTLLCTTVAALLGFTGSGALVNAALAPFTPTWLSAPSAISPSVLLVGR
ncbi:CnrY/NccY family anti-sigma factor [Azomonas macrocytogenes]|uniref:Uncharacterized protein n=1 Tax=Azomonas macrocytogenes TaxID=69962 RepID=A0A839T6G8_AZOMA|nr:CnrY/NccY family anti-sigma factor [Azomonas macrocytogenes]MBB3105081.1 hypothetical protein [Azomonas macrocytogenes]